MPINQQVNKLKIFIRASYRQRIAAVIVCLAVVGFFGLFALAGHYNIDMGRWLGYCGFKQRYELPCPTCGMTTATLAFAQGKIFEAFYVQPAGALLCCMLVVIGFLAFIIAVFGVYFRFLERFFREVKVKYIVLALIVIIAAGWVVTLVRALAANK